MKKIMVVDDAAFIRKSLIMIFQQNGFEIAGEAGNGVKAVLKYKELKPDLVTMDITMPEMNGIDAVKLLKNLNPIVRFWSFLRRAKKKWFGKPLCRAPKVLLLSPLVKKRLSRWLRKSLGYEDKMIYRCLGL